MKGPNECASRNAECGTEQGRGGPQALDLALEQLHDVLKSRGTEQLNNLIEGESTGYAQMAIVLEKLSKCALDWQEYRDRRHGATGDGHKPQAAGYSKQTEQQVVHELEGPPAPQLKEGHV